MPPPMPHPHPPNTNAPPFTVQLLMWLLPPEAAAAEQMTTTSVHQLRTEDAGLRVSRSVMYSDAGFDVSRCGRYLALCELDPAVGYHLRIFSLERPSLGTHLQTVTLPNCPFVTSVQFCPLTLAVLIGYGRCQARARSHVSPPSPPSHWSTPVPRPPPSPPLPPSPHSPSFCGAGDGAGGAAGQPVRRAALHQV